MIGADAQRAEQPAKPRSKFVASSERACNRFRSRLLLNGLITFEKSIQLESYILLLLNGTLKTLGGLRGMASTHCSVPPHTVTQVVHTCLRGAKLRTRACETAQPHESRDTAVSSQTWPTARCVRHICGCLSEDLTMCLPSEARCAGAGNSADLARSDLGPAGCTAAERNRRHSKGQKLPEQTSNAHNKGGEARGEVKH